MPRYNEVYISQQDFEISLHNEMRYDGFVEGMGYAYTSHFSIPPVHFQKHNPPGRVSNDQGFFQNGFVQYIDSSPQMRLMSVKYVHKVKSGDTLTSIAQQYGVSIQAVKDVNSNINWAGERKGDRILAGEELKLPNEVEDFADRSKSKGARSGNPLIGPTVARANFEQRLSKSLYGGDRAANGGGPGWEAYAGAAASIGSEMFYSKTYGTWMGKNFKMYQQTWGGNGFTGGKLKFGKKVSSGFKIGGYGLGLWNAYSVNSQHSSGQITDRQMYMEQGSNVLTTIGGLYGAGWGVGWELGRAISNTGWYQEAKFNFWYNRWESQVGSPSQSNEALWHYFYQNYKP